jgi:soluble lytic murein transglycosylase-like protein
VFPAQEILELARETAVRHGLEPELVCAVIEQESSWNPYAIRYEPEFRERYVAALRLPPTEEIARSISWGLMQVMGQVAREHGFNGRFLAELCTAAVGVEIGCKILAAKIANAGDSKKGLLLWNGGADPGYAQEVLDRVASYAAKL